MRFRTPAKLLLVAVAIACSPPPPEVGNINGTVKVAGGDLFGVFVTIPGTVTTADGEGKFAFNGLVPGEYAVSASKEGYVRASTKVTVATGQTAIADLSLVKVKPDNRPPVLAGFSSNPAIFARKEQGALLATASDPDGDPLTYTFTAGEGWVIASGDAPSSATITAPDASGVTTTVRVTVSDGQGGEAKGALLLATTANRAPVLEAIFARPNLLQPGGTAQLTASAVDADGDVPTYAWAAPEGWTIVSEGATATLTAPDTYDASALIAVTATDAAAARVSGTVLVSTVANLAPVFASIVALPNTVAPGGTIVLAASASDPNGDPITYTWTTPQAWPVTGTGANVSVTAPNLHGERVTVDVKADDGHGKSATASIALATTPNSAPIITSFTTTPPQAAPGGSLQLKVSASDPDGETLKYTWHAPSGWSITGTGNAVTLQAPATYGAVGEVTVDVTDTFNLATSASTVVSTIMNAAPVIASLVAVPAQAAPKGEIRVGVTARDPGDDPLTYAWTAPAGWSIKSGGATAEAVLVAPNEYGRSDTAVVTVSDGATNVTASVVVSTRPDRAPIIASLIARPTPVAKGGTVNVDLSASDPDGDPLTYAWSASNGWTLTGNGTSVSITAPTTNGATGLVTVVVSDGFGQSATAQAPLTVATNNPPRIFGLSVTGSPADRRGNITVSASAGDIDGDQITYTWSAPSGWTITGTAASVTVTAPNVYGQTGLIKLTVTDSGGLTTKDEVQVATRPNVVPVIASLTASPATVLPNAVSSLTTSASDPDGETLSYSYASSDSTWTLGGTGPVVSVRAPATSSGSTTVTATVSDPSGGVVTRIVTITITPCPGANTANCDGDAANGCEVQLQSDPLNCGVCSNVCSLPTPACGAGSCTADLFPAGTQVTFTSCGKNGQTGPTQAQCNTAYLSVPKLAGAVTVSAGGLQSWVVPTTGTYRITAVGAAGASNTGYAGGKGASATGDVTLSANSTLTILAGQVGTASANCDAGGGGGTFVVQGLSTLIMAGGGGGGASSGIAGYNAPNSTSGGNSCGTGGTSGNGGTRDPSAGGCGGGGFLTNGQASINYGDCAGRSFLNGGSGGPPSYASTPVLGGFGGGAGGHGSCWIGGGGGGGYSGGGAGGYCGVSGGPAGAGGGSFVSGVNTSITPGTGTGTGTVTILRMP